MAPIVHGLEPELYSDIEFVYLDVDDPANADTLSLLGFRYQPHFFLLDGEGKVLQQWLGPVTADEFRTVFAATIN